MMWNMMVVEDESIVRIGLRYMLDWEKLGVVWKAEAGNGEEALRLMDANDIHIVVTDIRMPIMDGIELVRNLKNRHPDVQAVVISSYNDFAYVQEALRLGVADYLHKPTMTATEVQASLERVLARLAQQPRRGSDAFLAASESSRAAISSGLILKQWLERLGTEGRPDNGPDAFLNNGGFRPNAPRDNGGGPSVAEAEAALRTSRLSQGYCLSVFRLEAGTAAGTGNSLFHSVSTLIQGYVVLSEGSLLATRLGYELLWLKPAGEDFDAEEHHLLLADIRRNVMNLLHVPLHCSASGVGSGLESMTNAYGEATAGFVEAGGYSQTIRLAKEYIDLHFRRDLSLSECAGSVHVSGGHLSRLFAKELGMNFSEYVNRKKLEHAKQLLGETNMKINKVAEEVGYLNPHYFSKLFKEYIGVTPREFRNI